MTLREFIDANLGTHFIPNLMQINDKIKQLIELRAKNLGNENVVANCNKGLSILRDRKNRKLNAINRLVCHITNITRNGIFLSNIGKVSIAFWNNEIQFRFTYNSHKNTVNGYSVLDIQIGFISALDKFPIWAKILINNVEKYPQRYTIEKLRREFSLFRINSQPLDVTIKGEITYIGRNVKYIPFNSIYQLSTRQR